MNEIKIMGVVMKNALNIISILKLEKIRKIIGAKLPIAFFLLLFTHTSLNAEIIDVDGSSCNLVDAINAANLDIAVSGCSAGNGADTLVLPAKSTITLTQAYADDTGLPKIQSEITIDGNGSTIERSNLEGTPLFRIFYVVASSRLALNNMTIKGAKFQGGLAGSAILNFGTTTVSNSLFTANETLRCETSTCYAQATSIINNMFDAHLTLRDSSVISNITYNNAAVSNFGGYVSLYSSKVEFNSVAGLAHYSGSTLVHDSSISHNKSMGIISASNSSSSAGLRIYRSLINANEGLGITKYGTSPDLIVSSTISNNTSGIFHGTGQLTLQNVTITANRYHGITSESDLLLSHSLIAGNAIGRPALGSQLDSQTGTVTNNGYNLIGDNSITNSQAFLGFTPDSTDIISTSDGNKPLPLSAILDSTLKDNGGHTHTYALVANSPAVDVSPDEGECKWAKDQRGIHRSMDGDNDGFYKCDIGAYEFTNGYNIATIKAPVQEQRASWLYDRHYGSFWNSDGNAANTWFEIILNKPAELKQLRMVPAENRGYAFAVYVDDVHVGDYKFIRSSTVAFQYFDLPAGTYGKHVRIKAVNSRWFKIYEVDFIFSDGEVPPPSLPTKPPEPPPAETSKLPISDVEAGVNQNRNTRLVDGDLTTAWNSDGKIANAWFKLSLASRQEVRELRIAPRTDRAYKFNVYVDNTLVGKYTTKRNPTVELQSFAIPAGHFGSIIRIESTSHGWLKIHEVELYGEGDGDSTPPPTSPTACGNALPINAINVPARNFRKKYLIDDDLAGTSFWSNNEQTWIQVYLSDSQSIKCLQIAPRTDRAYSLNVYVDSVFVGQYTTTSAPTVKMQEFLLPTGVQGSNIIIESVNHTWFKVHELKLLGN